MDNLLIQNCAVLKTEPSKLSIQQNSDIVISGNHITAIQVTGREDKSKFSEIIDARGMLAMPGLINTHAHVPMVIFRGLAEDVNLDTWFNDYMWPLEQNLEPDDVYWGMMLGLAEMIEAGITTVADHYFYMDRAAKAVEEAGTRALLGWAVFGSQGRDGLIHTARFAEKYQGAAHGRISTCMAPHAPYTCDIEFLKETARMAADLNTGIHIHAAETITQTTLSLEKTGMTPIQILEKSGILNHPVIIAHGCGITDGDIVLMAGRPCGIAHAPKTYLKLAMGMTPLRKLIKSGIPVGLATDGAVSNNTLDIWESMRLMAMFQKHATGNPETMTIPETLDIATQGSARVMHLQNSIGRLAPGYLADIILVDMSGIHNQPLHSMTANLVYSTRASDVQTVIVDGKIIMQDRKLLTMDKKLIIDQVSRSMERLALRVPEKRIQTYNP